MIATGLVASTFLGSWILENDQWLWSSAPSHAYGLAGFVLVNAILAVLVVVWKTQWPARLVSMATFVQTASMLSDLAGGQPMGVPVTAFRQYLLGDSSFVALLSIQVAIILVVLESGLVGYLHRHSQWFAPHSG